MKPDSLSPNKTNVVNIMTLLLGLVSLLFCSCGVLLAFSFPLHDVNIDSVDTSIFTPQTSVLTGLCLWIPALITAVAAVGIWFSYGRTPLQRQLTQLQSEVDMLRAMALQTYLDQIGQMIIKENFGHNKPDATLIQFAQRRTQETLAVLDSRRQRQLLQFLFDSQLADDLGVKHVEYICDD